MFNQTKLCLLGLGETRMTVGKYPFQNSIMISAKIARTPSSSY